MFLSSIAFAITAQQAKIDFAKAWSGIRAAIEQRYYAKNERATQMKQLLDKYEPIAKASGSEAEFEKNVNDMITDFGDSHFGFFTKSNQGFYVMDILTGAAGADAMPNICAWFRAVANR